ncbi:TPA: hypothetical protein ACH3X3_007875 [Trebouxia sp. C0006]
MSYGALVSALNSGEKRHFQSAELTALTASGLVTLNDALSAPAGPVGTQVPGSVQGHLAHSCCHGGVRDQGSAGPDRPQNQAKEEAQVCQGQHACYGQDPG